MPQLDNAKKALRQADRRFLRNNVIRQEISSARRLFRKALEAGKMEEAKKMMIDLQKRLDKAVKKNVFKKNKSARINSRLAAAFNRSTAKKK